uniref:Putative site-specific tyrosine recombinase n=1 Tax=viral metagenome TaxID=1070528 RepID=A0A6M3LHD6_9ZZZZ
MDISEVEKVIGTLNQEMWETNELEYIYLDMSANGYCMVVEFLGHQIWTSEWDEREYNEKEDKYEPLEGYLRREINKEIEKLKRIKL